MPSATRTVKAKVELDGEKEFNAAIKQLNAGSKTLKSEMALLQAQYKGNTQSVEYLTAKSDLYGRMLDQQKEKTALTRKMYEESVKAFEKASKAYADAENESAEAMTAAADALAAAELKMQSYAQKLNYAQAAEFDLQHEIDDTNASIDKQGEAMEDLDDTAEETANTMRGLGDVVGDLTGKFGIQLPDGAKKAMNSMSSLSTGTVAAMGVAAAGVMALIKSVKALQQETLEAASRADDILTRSAQMNISAQQYMQLQYASPFVDIDVDTMAKSLQTLTKAMGAAAAGGEDAQKKFAGLGVSITNVDGSLRNSYDVWLDTMDAISGITNETERDVAAQTLLGNRAAELASIYREGTDALREYSAAAEENYVMSDEQLERLGAVDDAWNKMQLDIENNKNMIAAEWAPTAKEALEAFDRLVSAAGKALVDSGIIQGFGELVQFAVGLLDPIADLLSSADSAPGRIKPVYEVLHGIAGALALIGDAANWVIGLLQTITIIGARQGLERMGNAMGFGASSGNYSNMQKWNGTAATMEAQRGGYIGNGGADMSSYGYDAATGRYYDPKTGNYIYGFNASGNDNWRGGLTWVGETGPELALLPAGTQIMNAQDSRGLGGDVINISVDVGSLEDLESLIRWAKGQKIRGRMR